MKKLYLFAVCTLLGSSMMLAQGKRIPSAPGGPPKSGGASQKTGTKNYSYAGCDATVPANIADGSLLQDYVGPLGAYAVYAIGVQPGHSYSAEVWNPFGQDLTSVNGRPSLAVADSTCYFIPFTDVSGWAPALTRGFSARISWTQTSDPLDYVALYNNDYWNGYSYNLRITDTTLHSPRWTTWSGFVTQYGFINTTNAAISGVLTVTDDVSGPYPPVSVTIPANGQIFEIISGTGNGSPGLNLAPGHAGFADFAFIGPAGAIVADAYYLNSNATVVVPSSFAPRNYQH
jgi:hypothetical protein